METIQIPFKQVDLEVIVEDSANHMETEEGIMAVTAMSNLRVSKIGINS